MKTQIQLIFRKLGLATMLFSAVLAVSPAAYAQEKAEGKFKRVQKPLLARGEKAEGKFKMVQKPMLARGEKAEGKF